MILVNEYVSFRQLLYIFYLHNQFIYIIQHYVIKVYMFIGFDNKFANEILDIFYNALHKFPAIVDISEPICYNKKYQFL